MEIVYLDEPNDAACSRQYEHRRTSYEIVVAAAKSAGAWVGPKGPPRLPPKQRLRMPRNQAMRFARIELYMDYHARALPPLAVKCWVILWREHRPHPDYDNGASVVSLSTIVERTGANRRNVRRSVRLLERNGYAELLKPGEPGSTAIRFACMPRWWSALIQWV